MAGRRDDCHLVLAGPILQLMGVVSDGPCRQADKWDLASIAHASHHLRREPEVLGSLAFGP